MGKQGYKRISNQTERVDKETGEVELMTVNRVISYPREPEYVKLYISDLSSLKLPPQMLSVLLELVSHMDYQNRITVSLGVKKNICDKLRDKKKKPSIKTVTDYLSILCKKKILKRQHAGIYIANPFIFGKGSWQDISDVRDMWK